MPPGNRKNTSASGCSDAIEVEEDSIPGVPQLGVRRPGLRKRNPAIAPLHNESTGTELDDTGSVPSTQADGSLIGRARTDEQPR